jgi:hypothetical protein
MHGFWWENRKKRDNQEDPILSRRIILKWSLGKQDEWYGLDSSNSG